MRILYAPILENKDLLHNFSRMLERTDIINEILQSKEDFVQNATSIEYSSDAQLSSASKRQ